MNSTRVTLIEVLESRIAPATHIWTGPAAGGVWSSAANWNGGVPTTGEAGGTIVQFDGGISSTDNIAGLVVNQIHFTAGGNTIFGSGGISLGINGTLVTNNLVNDAGANTIDSTLPLVNSAASTFILIPQGSLTLKSNISGTQGITILDGSANGVVTFAGVTNSYAGTTTVRDGTLALNSNGLNTAIPGALVIGNNTGAAGSAVVRLFQNVEIADTSAITIASEGVLDFNGNTDAVGSLTLQSGSTSGATVTTGAGTLMLGGDVTVTLSGTNTVGATIAGKLNFGGATRDFNVANGAAASDLKITATIVGGGGFTKSGAGRLELASSAANVTGDVTVEDGVLYLNSAAVDGAVSGNLMIGDQVGAAASAQVLLAAANQIVDTSVIQVRHDGQLALNGVNEITGALIVESGTTTAASITTGQGSLTVLGDVVALASGTGAVPATISGTLDFGTVSRSFLVADGAASSDLIISAKITGSAGYTKLSTGTLEVQNAGPSGVVKVTGGTLLLNSPGASDAILVGLDVGSDTGNAATVRLLHDAQISDTAVVSVRTDGTLDLNGFSDLIGDLSLRDGTASASSVTTGAGVLSIGGLTSVFGLGTAATGATIAGQIDFLGHPIAVNDYTASSDLIITAQIVGTSGYTKSGAGTLEIKALSTTGPVNVYGGTLLLNSNGADDAVRGPLTIGQLGVLNSATVRLAQPTEISNQSLVTVNASGILDLNGFPDAIGQLVLQSGSTAGAQVVTGAGTLTLQGSLSTIVSGDGAVGASITGNLVLSAGAHVFTIAEGVAGSDLKITALISGAGGLTKAGPGTLEISNNPTANTYTGDTVIADGIGLYVAPVSTDSTSGQIIIGDGVGAPGSAIFRLGLSSVIENTANISVLADGLLDFNSRNDTVGNVDLQAGGALSLGNGIGTFGNFSFAAGARFTTGDSGRLIVNGTVTLGGRLNLNTSVASVMGTVRTIITNDGNDAVTGTFSGLPEGTVFGTAAGLLKISYVGGDGNDVTLTAVDATSVLTIAASGKSATFTDIDGDLVTVKTTKGVLTKDNFQFGSIGSGLVNGFQLQTLLLNSAQFNGAAITITAKPTTLGGNGHVNVGSIDASGHDLASLIVPGDLGALEAGDNDVKKPGLGKFVADSFGTFGSITQRLGSDQFAQVLGIGSFTVKGDVRGADLSLGAAGTIAIGGSLLGSAETGDGNLLLISAKKVTLGGSLVAAAGTSTGRITASGDLLSVSIGADVVGAAQIVTDGKLGAVVIKGGVTGASSASPARISGAGSAVAPKAGADTAIASLTIGKSAENLLVQAGYDHSGVAVSADAAIGKIMIGGDLRASSILVGAAPGNDGLFGTADDTKSAVLRDSATRYSTIASLIIKGQALGTTNSVSTADFFSIVAEQITTAKIGGTALKLKAGPRSAADTVPLGFIGSGPGNLPTDFYLHEISA